MPQKVQNGPFLCYLFQQQPSPQRLPKKEIGRPLVRLQRRAHNKRYSNPSRYRRGGLGQKMTTRSDQTPLLRPGKKTINSTKCSFEKTGITPQLLDKHLGKQIECSLWDGVGCLQAIHSRAAPVPVRTTHSSRETKAAPSQADEYSHRFCWFYKLVL